LPGEERADLLARGPRRAGAASAIRGVGEEAGARTAPAADRRSLHFAVVLPRPGPEGSRSAAGDGGDARADPDQPSRQRASAAGDPRPGCLEAGAGAHRTGVGLSASLPARAIRAVCRRLLRLAVRLTRGSTPEFLTLSR